MARWCIERSRSGEKVLLTYYAAGAAPQNLGEGGAEVEASLEAWVVEQAVVFDQVQTRRGVFVRLATPNICA